jgi:hypothetical protein
MTAFDFRDFWSGPIPSLAARGLATGSASGNSEHAVLKQNDLVGLFRKNSEDTLSLLLTLA